MRYTAAPSLAMPGAWLVIDSTGCTLANLFHERAERMAHALVGVLYAMDTKPDTSQPAPPSSPEIEQSIADFFAASNDPLAPYAAYIASAM